jgi:LysM repeat protein
MGTSFNTTFARMSETTPGVDFYGVLRHSVAAGVRYAFLIEHGYHTNYQDCLILSDDAALRRIASATAEVIGKYLGLTGAQEGALPGGCRFSYIVQPGDTLFIIGERFGVPWRDIVTAGGMSPPYNLVIGQQLAIPWPRYTAPHTVRPGESLSLIAQRYGASWQEIARINGISAPYRLTSGQQLLIPQGCQFYYTVSSGDTVSLIGQMFGVPWQQIAEANGLRSPYRLTPRQRIMIPLSEA